MSSPYSRIAGSQQRTPSPIIPTICPTPPTGLFTPSSPTSLLQPPTEQTTSISIDPPEIPTQPKIPIPEEHHASYSQATPEERKALIAAYLCDNPIPPNDTNDTMPELKAGLPGNFSGREEDANLWLLQMKAYFTLNPSLYEEKNRILAFLNKMDQG